MAVPSPSKTLYEKLFDNHTITTREDGSTLIYIDRHLIHEMTSPQAFEGLRVNERLVRRPDLTLATADHNVPTTTRKGITDIEGSIADEESRIQCRALRDNAVENGIKFYGLDHRLQGIVHVIGPELGFTLPGMTIVCGDSHTSTHGAFGSLAFGIGTTEVEHVLATQTLVMSKSKTMRINITGKLRPFVTSKDLMLYIIGTIGTAGGTGKVIEYAGETIEGLSMEARMSLCNMSIEAGARAGLVAPDATTIEYLRGRPLLAQWDEQTWKDMESYWMSLRTDAAAVYDFNVDIRAEDVAPMVTWGTSPEQVVPISSAVPDPATQQDPAKAESWTRALKYIGLEAGQRMEDVKIDKVFIGSCTNSRLEDLRQAAEVARGKRVSPHIKTALVVPGSGSVKVAAEAEGLDKVFIDAGFEWREAGCSMCCGVNDDKLMVKERSASTSNRNFENRQGTGSRTHLCSPAMAAAAAIHGHLADVRNMTIVTTSESRPTSPPIIISMDEGDDETLLQTHAESELDFTSGSKKQPHDETNNGQPRRGLAPRKQRLNRDKAQQTPPPPSSSPSSHPSERGLRQLRGRVIPLDRSNVDTDCIMPTRYCKTVRRSGLGKGLFYNLRRLADGSGNLDPSFPLNQQRFAGSSILLSLGPNFGCGSSREHAVWALLDYGFRCVIAPSFADIFYNNSFKAGLLPIALPPAAISKLAALAEAGVDIEVDIVASKIVDADGSEIASFDMDPHRKEAMVKGLDDIGLTLEKLQKIISYEEERYKQFPWVDGAPPSLMRQAVVA